MLQVLEDHGWAGPRDRGRLGEIAGEMIYLCNVGNVGRYCSECIWYGTWKLYLSWFVWMKREERGERGEKGTWKVIKYGCVSNIMPYTVG
jgi:hypothetical protein